MSAVGQARAHPAPPASITQKPGNGLWVAPAVLDACRSVSLRIDGPRLNSLGVTSAIRGEGRTTIAVALALIQAADYRRRVTLVELDFGNPSLADRFGLNPRPGLAELAHGEVDLAQVLQPAGDSIAVIVAGMPGGSASRTMMDVLRSGVLQDIGAESDVIVGDLPATLSGGFGDYAAQTFDQLVFVVRAGITPLARVREAMVNLSSEPALVLNGTDSSLPRWLRAVFGLW